MNGLFSYFRSSRCERKLVKYFYFNAPLSINITLGYNADFGSMKAVFRSIQRDWAEMIDPNCVPVQLALQFMDSSSLGRANQTQQFQDAYAELQRALKAIVNGICTTPLPRTCVAALTLRRSS